MQKAPDTFVHEEAVEEASIVTEDHGCSLAASVGTIAALQGTSCQQVFVFAFNRQGVAGSVARAEFVKFLTESQSDIPPAVQAYAKRAKKIASGTYPKKGFCIGCTMATHALQGLVEAYRVIHPEVWNGKSTLAVETLSAQSEADQLFLDMLESGVLNEEDEQWYDLVEEVEIDDLET